MKTPAPRFSSKTRNVMDVGLQIVGGVWGELFTGCLNRKAEKKRWKWQGLGQMEKQHLAR
jgi:hypothetical protein